MQWCVFCLCCSILCLPFPCSHVVIFLDEELDLGSDANDSDSDQMEDFPAHELTFDDYFEDGHDESSKNYGPLLDTPSLSVDSVETRLFQSLKREMDSVKNNLLHYRKTIFHNIPDTQKLPEPVGMWNKVKGGVDTLTQLIESNSEKMVCSPSSKLVMRLLRIVLVAGFRAYQVVNMKTDESITSLSRFRKRKRVKYSFDSYLAELLEYLADPSGNPFNCKNPPIPSSQNNGPVCDDSSLFLLGSQSQLTPTKGNVRSSSLSLRNRRRNCVGPLVYMGSRHPCEMCRESSSWFCIQCLCYFCPKAPKGDSKVRVFSIDRLSNKDVEESCFFAGHKAAWNRYYKKLNE